MSAGSQLALKFPFLLASLLVGVALLGSSPSASLRARVERVLLPLLTAVLAAGWAVSLGLALRGHDWVFALFWALFGAYSGWRMSRTLRKARTMKNERHES